MPFDFLLALRTKFWHSRLLSTNYRCVLIRPIYLSIKIEKRIMCLEYMFCTSLEHQIVLPEWEQSCVLSTNKSRTHDILSTALLWVSCKEKKKHFLLSITWTERHTSWNFKSVIVLMKAKRRVKCQNSVWEALKVRKHLNGLGLSFKI